MTLSPNDDDTLNPVPVQVGRPVLVTGWAARSSVGARRQENQDSWGESEDRIFAVADGVGGTEGGARASTLAIAGLMSADPSNGWIEALVELSLLVREQCDAEGFPQAASTLVAVVAEEDRCVLLSVGDSRVYRLRQGELRLLTADHNVAREMTETGRSLDETTPRQAGALTSYIGNTDRSQRVDVGTAATCEGDRLLLCSDGVHGQLTVEQLQVGLSSPSCADAASWLVEQSDQAGGRDNATALVVEFGMTP